MTSRRIREAVRVERTSKVYAKNYDEISDKKGLFKLDTKLLDEILKTKGKLFDAMMGRGRHILHFAKKGYEVYGNDYNFNMVRLVREDFRKQNLKSKLYNLNVTDLSRIPSNIFDYVICMFSSLGCVPGSSNREKAVKEFARTAKTNGLVVIHAHNRLGNIGNFKHMSWVFKTYLHRDSDLELGDVVTNMEPLGESYIHIFSPFEMRYLFKKAGLKILKEYYLNNEQDGLYKGPLKTVKGRGFIFVGKKI